ncbi:MAG: hypothetical protein RBU27_11870 [Bacteroidota bacterium]|jgi:hypothetical protein|nr:hypothetical protein [Bacteroidota bacterium]
MKDDIFDRNIRNSLLVNGGEFERVLADIIQQLESPPSDDGRVHTAWEMTRRIAESMREGFAGLHPNGFDFACWLWETAPLHVVGIPQANSIGTMHGYRYGVVHLRKIAAMLAGWYVMQQPQKMPLVVELIDMSLDWIDARNLITYGLVDYLEQHVTDELPTLEQLADEERRWRRLVPLGVAARLLGTRSPEAPVMYQLLERSVAHDDDPHVHQALRYVLRIAGMYGDVPDLLRFIDRMRRHAATAFLPLVCETLRNPRLRWDAEARQAASVILTAWRDAVDTSVRPSLDRIIQSFGSVSSL